MTNIQKPVTKPANPNFSSGPCAKRPGWTVDALSGALVGRSHRSGPGKAKLAEVIDRTRAILSIPDDYQIGIVPASDTGAVEMALWSFLGTRPVDVLAWESFGSGWAGDIIKQLKISDTRLLDADYGELANLGAVDFSRDVVFAWNGTTSGVKVPNGDWIPVDREGITICDATSAAFAMELPWDKLDVTTYSWQKVMGGEAQHGMIILSPRAVARLEGHTPTWPMPKIFTMAKSGKLIAGIFKGETINTPSMLAVEDAIDGLKWAEQIGGRAELMRRSNANLKAIEDWVEKSDWAGFLAANTMVRSNTSVCLKVTDSSFTALSDDEQGAQLKQMVKLLDGEGVAYDIGGYRDAPAGLRIWAGATVETSDIEKLLPWLDWAFATVNSSTN
ncbi:MAG: phosphoserine transaminase [Rhodospirillaceae bacterium]|nr:phosphoserine transaminase [Rhodospirillaceae bacterium]